MSGADALHSRGALKAKILAALATGPLTPEQLATAIGYTGKLDALSATVYHHIRQGTIERGPGRPALLGLPGTVWLSYPGSIAPEKAAKVPKPRPPSKRELAAIALLEARGYTVSRPDNQTEVIAHAQVTCRLELPPRPAPLLTPPKADRDQVSRDIAEFEAKGGRIERLPTNEPVPHLTVPAYPGTR